MVLMKPKAQTQATHSPCHQWNYNQELTPANHHGRVGSAEGTIDATQGQRRHQSKREITFPAHCVMVMYIGFLGVRLPVNRTDAGSISFFLRIEGEFITP
jgi:hypothetical protein